MDWLRENWQWPVVLFVVLFAREIRGLLAAIAVAPLRFLGLTLTGGRVALGAVALAGVAILGLSFAEALHVSPLPAIAVVAGVVLGVAALVWLLIAWRDAGEKRAT